MSGFGFDPLPPKAQPIVRDLRAPGGPWTKISETDYLEPLDVAGKDVPGLHEWLRISHDGPAPDALESRITELVSLYWTAAGNEFQKAFVLVDLYRRLDSWLARGPQQTKLRPGAQGRQTAMLTLYKIVVSQLCTFFKVAPNGLPNMLERGAFKEMEHTEAGEAVSYMNAVEREATRLTFDRTRQLWERYSAAAHGIVTVNTNDAEMLAGSSQAGWDQPLLETDAGYVLSLWGGIYSTQHDRNLHKFHSQYMGGKPVVCAGEMTIRNGILSRISNSSGHYRPSPEQLNRLLWVLIQMGVPMAALEVIGMEADPAGDRLYCLKTLAPDFLASGGRSATAEHWLKRLDNQFKWFRLRPAEGRIRFANGRVVAGFIVKFEQPLDATLDCRATVKPDGTFVMQTAVGKPQRFVNGAMSLGGYIVRVYMPGQGTNLIKVGELAGTLAVADNAVNPPLDLLVDPA
jgi:hypothetical protein